MKYECDMIRDLMPLCADGIASETSEKTLQAHLAECKACAAEWKNVKDGNAAFPETEVPEETRQYAKTAKRVKKKNFRRLIAAALCTVLVLGIGSLLYTMGIYGGRFSPEKTAIRLMKLNQVADEFEPLYTDSPSLRKEKFCFLKYNDPDSGKPSIIAVDVFGFGPLWFAATVFGDMEIPTEKGVFAVTEPLQFPYQVGYYFYVTDPAVQEIRMTYRDKVYSVLPKNCQGGICPVYLEHYRYQSVSGDISCAAYDADGNVLYTMQDQTWVHA